MWSVHIWTRTRKFKFLCTQIRTWTRDQRTRTRTLKNDKGHNTSRILFHFMTRIPGNQGTRESETDKVCVGRVLECDVTRN